MINSRASTAGRQRSFLDTFFLASALALLVFNQALQAGPLDTWTFSNPLPSGSQLRSVTFGNGQFVAVGHTSAHYEALIVTSSDSTNWFWRLVIPRSTNGLTIQFSDVAYGDGVFVAVGSILHELVLGSAIFTSLDGVTWVPHLFGGDGFEGFQSIAYGNRQFVALKGRQSATSVNGMDWIFHGLQDASVGGSIAYGNGQFVATWGGNDSSIATSADGVNWVTHQLKTKVPRTLSRNGIAFGNGQFVAVGYEYRTDQFRNKILTSADGVNWIERNSGVTDGQLAAVTYGDGQFVVVGSGIILTSADGTDWTRHEPSGFDAYMSDVAYGGGRFVAVGVDGMILRSGSVISVAVALNIRGGLSLSVQGPPGNGYTIQTSTDLISWQDASTIPATQSTQTMLFSLPAVREREFYRAYVR